MDLPSNNHENGTSSAQRGQGTNLIHHPSHITLISTYILMHDITYYMYIYYISWLEILML